MWQEIFAFSGCCTKEGFSETCLILLNKNFLSSSRQASDFPGKVVPLVRDKLTLHLSDKGQHFYALHVTTGYHQSFQLLSQSEHHRSEPDSWSWLQWRRLDHYSTQVNNSFMRHINHRQLPLKIAWARQQSGNKAATQLPVPLPSHKAHPPVCLHQQMLPRVNDTALQLSSAGTY